MQVDLHERYGIDTGDRTLMQSRPWSWLRLRIRGLLDLPDSRISAALHR